MDFSTFLLWIAGAAAVLLVFSWVLRKIIAAVAPRRVAAVFRTAPLTAVFGLTVISIYIVLAVFAPAFAPFSEREVVGMQYLPWEAPFLLGTDSLGRDMLSRLIFGARNTVGIAFITTIIAFFVGTLLGMLAAIIGNWFDQVLSRLVDVVMSVPSLILALLLLTIVGASTFNLVIVIALIDATRVFRITRAVSINIVNMDYIEVARLRGESLWRLIVREILPNASAPLIAEFGLRFCFVFLTIASLSFLGLGLQPPTADWGSMVRENASLITFGDPTPLLAAGAIALLTVSVNFVVDWFLHRASGLKD